MLTFSERPRNYWQQILFTCRSFQVYALGDVRRHEDSASLGAVATRVDWSAIKVPAPSWRVRVQPV
jgi:hypothetical protein